MYQNVLIPTDGSDGTRQAIAHGLTVADRFDSTVHVLSVVPEGPFGTASDGNATVAAERAIDYVATKAKERSIPVSTTIERGVPHECILEYATANEIDMIVMGTQGRTGLDRFLVGSVTERTVRMADQPVVTVRRTDTVRIDAVDDAVRTARDALEFGDEPSVVGDPYRTNGAWVVSFGTTEGNVRVHVDAVTGDTVRVSSQS